jgi:hypothetical protein
VNNCLAKGVLNRSAIWPIGMSLGNYLIVCKYLNMTPDKNLRLAKFRGLTPCFLLQDPPSINMSKSNFKVTFKKELKA